MYIEAFKYGYVIFFRRWPYYRCSDSLKCDMIGAATRKRSSGLLTRFDTNMPVKLKLEILDISRKGTV